MVDDYKCREYIAQSEALVSKIVDLVLSDSLSSN
jgi:hypothetical protein